MVNCLVNADFYQGWSVLIEKYPDRIVMANPGTIITGKRQMLKGGISQPRNRGLFKMFNLIGLGEHAGSGVPDIYHVWKELGLEEPEVEERFGNPDRTTLTLPLIQSEATNLGTFITTSGEEGGEEKKKQIIAFCREPRSKTEIKEYLEIKSERYVREKLITPLLKNGDIRRTIPDQPKNRNQKYISTKTEMERAQAILDNNPVLMYSPGELRREGKSIEEYLEKFGEAERKKYSGYYEDEM